MSKSCCSAGNVLIFACSGGSNVGQLTNEIGKRLHEEGYGKLFCLAGIGGGIASMIATTRQAEFIVALNGCPIACAKATLERAELPVSCNVLLTELGIAKEPNLAFSQEQADSAYEKVVSVITAPFACTRVSSVASDSDSSCVCDCDNCGEGQE